MPAELIAFTITRLPAAAVVGQAVHYRMGAPDGNPLPALWERMAKDGTLTQLGALPTRILPEVWIGWMGYFNPVENSMLYLAGVLVAPDTEAPAKTMDSIPVQAEAPKQPQTEQQTNQ